MAHQSGTFYKDLKRQFLTGEIIPEEFQNKILELDQSTPDRNNSLKNIELLCDKEIVSWFTQNSEYLPMYSSLLSLTEFHVAQSKACDEKDDKEAYEHFKKALEAGQKIYDENADWIIYIKATLAYLENDLVKLRKLTGQASANSKTLERLIHGLEKRGAPKYSEDY